MEYIEMRIEREGYLEGYTTPSEPVERGAYRQIVDTKEADICLSCPLKKCRPTQCARFKREAAARGIL